MGLLDFLNTDEARQGISLLGAASPTMQPMGFGERLALAMRGMDDIQFQKQQKEMRNLQLAAMKESAGKKQAREFAIANLSPNERMQMTLGVPYEKIIENNRADNFARGIPGMGGQAQPISLPQLGEAQGTGPYTLDVSSPDQQANIVRQVQQLRANGDNQTADQIIAALVKQGAIQAPTRNAAPNAEGVAQYALAGSLGGVKGANELYNYAKDFLKPDWQQIDNGGQISFVNKNGGQMPTIPKTPSPESLLTNQVARDRLNFDQHNAVNGRVPVGYRQTPDGNMTVIQGGPADVKTQALAQQKAAGAADVDSAIASLRDAYDRLENKGGITSTKKSGLDNLTASLSSSGAGQALGRAFGTDNQSARNDIAMTRHVLLAALMKATGMSAKQMDSNAELKLWMTTATDPTLDVEANRRALNAIEKKYLGGASAGGVSAQPPKQPVATGMYNGRRVVKFSDGSVDYAD